MKRHKLSVGLVVDTWFPDFGGIQLHIQSLRSKLHQHFNTRTELFYAGRTSLLFRFLWPFIVTFQIINHHKRKPFDLLHSHGVVAGIPAKLASIILGIPVIHTVHGSPNLDQQKLSFKFLLERWVLTKIKFDQQITVAKNFIKHPNRNAHITTIPNGVNVAKFNQVKVRKNKNPSLIWVGKDSPEKGLEYLKEAISRVRKKIPLLESELVTGGRLTGENLIKAYKKSHLFVLPSLAEGQPITLLEAWAAKLPVVATNVGDNAKLIQHGVNGLLVEAENVNQLTVALLKILRSKTKAKKMGLTGHKTVKKKFSWLNTAQQTYNVYKKVILKNKH